MGGHRLQVFERAAIGQVRSDPSCPETVVAAAPGSPIVGQTVEAVEHRAEGAFFIVQVDRQGGDTITNPGPDTRIEAGDGIVMVGRGAKARAQNALFTARAFRTSAR
jgi:Trk K+ transport system NAD-binding subunit